MFGIAAIVAFGIALIIDLGDLGKDHATWQTFTIAGLLCLAVHLCAGSWPFRRSG